MFIETMASTLLGTVAGGGIASFIGFKVTRRASSIEASYDVVHYILSDEMTKKRVVAKDSLIEYPLDDLVCSTAQDGEIFDKKLKIINLLNYYDTVCGGMTDGMLNEVIIRRTIWEFMRDDHIVFEQFIEQHSKRKLQERPLFPCLRDYQKKWG